MSRPGHDRRGARPVHDSLEAVVEAWVGPEGRVLVALAGRWEETVGTDLAPHCRPVRFDGGVLVVAVDHPVRALQVRRLAERIRKVAGEGARRPPARVEVVVRAALHGRDQEG